MLLKLFEHSAELQAAHRLAQQFLVLARQRRGHELEAWSAAVLATGPPELRGFSRNLHRDWAAVNAGLSEQWNSGPVEGHINRVNSVS